MDGAESVEGSLSPPFDEVVEQAVPNGTSSLLDMPTTPAEALAFIWRVMSLDLRIILSALFIIYVGAHASLRRPPSAAPATKTRTGKPRKKEEDENLTQGLLPSDAILFPIMAGIVLVGLYYLIQWLQDPAILNKIMNYYISFASLVSLSGLIAHFIQHGANFVFPNFFRYNGAVYEFDSVAEQICPAGSAQEKEPKAQASSEQHPASPELVVSPLPFRLLRTSNQKVNKFLWELRHLLTEEWTVRIRLHGILSEKFQIQFSHILGMVAAIGIVSTYVMTGSRTLSNVMGHGLCFGSFLFLSPTTFTTGSLVLCGLFFYDIVMVFYTPYMITVATKIDAPIKLTFEGPGRASMLGLGDIVVPGMVMALALRFDLWRFYLNKIKYVETELATELAPTEATGGQVVTTTEIRHIAKKAPYTDVTGRWADRFWLSSWFGLFFKPSKDVPEEVRSASFPKTYFYASLVGYSLGMIVTFCMLVIFKHGQPALLYLVPGVLGSLWLTGLVRGELKEMWTYTEDGSIDTQDVVVELDGSGNVIKEISNGEEDKKKADEEKKKTEDREREAEKKRFAETRAKRGYDVFHFSIRAPPRGGVQEKDEKEKSA